MQIMWPETQIRETIDAIRDAIGREIQINIIVSGIGCPVCSLDPVTNVSIDSFCTTCHGVYWLDTTSGYLVSGHVRWYSMDTPMLYPGGVLPEGDCRVTIAYTEENLYAVQHAADIVVDGKRTTIKNYRLKGQHLPNRIAITLTEEGQGNG